MLDRYQQEAYWALMKIARQHGGAFLCDGVGLGKTFVGLMLIERLSCTRASASCSSRRRRRRRRSGSRICASGSATSAASAAARLQQPRRLQPHRPRPQGRLPGALRADHRAGRRGDHRRGPSLPEPGPGRRPARRQGVALPQAVRPPRPGRSGRSASSCSPRRRSTTGSPTSGT